MKLSASCTAVFVALGGVLVAVVITWCGCRDESAPQEQQPVQKPRKPLITGPNVDYDLKYPDQIGEFFDCAHGTSYTKQLVCPEGTTPHTLDYSDEPRETQALTGTTVYGCRDMNGAAALTPGPRATPGTGRLCRERPTRA